MKLVVGYYLKSNKRANLKRKNFKSENFKNVDFGPKNAPFTTYYT